MKVQINNISFEIIDEKTSDFYSLGSLKGWFLNDSNSVISDFVIEVDDVDEFKIELPLLFKIAEESTKSIKVLTKNLDDLTAFLKSIYFIEAAGGVVSKNNQVLFIHRLDKWDLPKGKMEKGELPEETAIREVEEECSVRVKSNGKLVNTYHTYPYKKGLALKKTYWYEMECLEDDSMQPQTEEGIDELKYFDRADFNIPRSNTYDNILYVLDVYLGVQ